MASLVISLLCWLRTVTKATSNPTWAGSRFGARTTTTRTRQLGYPLEMTATGVSRVMPPAIP